MDNDGGIIAKGTFGSGADLITSGAGIRLIWYPKKAAFRAGRAAFDEWNDVSIGSYSVAMGNRGTASGNSSTVCGGFNGEASGDQSTVCGGATNTASGERSFVGTGINNTASGGNAFVGCGSQNSASGPGAFIGSGGNNEASNNGAVVVGGVYNEASGYISSVGGGWENISSNSYSTVPGGYMNTAGGQYSFAAGRQAKANHDGCFVWADDTDANFTSTGTDQFLIRASGGVGIGTDDPKSPLHVVGLPGYASDAAAGADGLTEGAFYQTNGLGVDPPFNVAGIVMVKQP